MTTGNPMFPDFYREVPCLRFPKKFPKTARTTSKIIRGVSWISRWRFLKNPRSSCGHGGFGAKTQLRPVFLPAAAWAGWAWGTTSFLMLRSVPYQFDPLILVDEMYEIPWNAYFWRLHHHFRMKSHWFSWEKVKATSVVSETALQTWKDRRLVKNHNW